MNSSELYRTYRKPAWAPPAWLFAPVWTVLYVLIAISFGYVGYLWFSNLVPSSIFVLFALNLIFNLAFTPIQFGLKNFTLAALDILLVLVTLAAALYAVYPYAPWVAYMNIPYLAWVSFATILQITVTWLNR
jgi:translocator protein